MAASLNVIALISGGKDSLFSILHCQANGHRVVALANLHPVQSANEDEDIDSYMYQTVGHAIIPLYEHALDIPLYRQVITGGAVNSSRDYEQPVEQEQDETEDLVPLLERVIQAHPEANAVSTGAILSTYQRTRVESVACRVGLTPLSYLWQYPLLPPYSQSSLLHDMAAVGQGAIIIKTASGGLDESFLGLNVADKRTIAKLSSTMARFGEAGNGAIVGEGGEFETLALRGPRSLWKKRIKIVASSTQKVDGGQTILRITESNLEDNTDSAYQNGGALRIPELFDDEFETILDATDIASKKLSSRAVEFPVARNSNEEPSPLSDTSSLDNLPTNASSDTPTIFTYANLIGDPRSQSGTSPSRQLTKILLRLDHVIKQWNVFKSNINHCTLLLRDMADFTVLNPVYGQYFNSVNPPARVTIAAGDAMPTGVDVMLSITLDKDEFDRKVRVIKSTRRQGLHVQGLSYWAPANIGPYSQAISVQLPASGEDAKASEMVYVAGQIPLVPASMSVYTTHGFEGQVLLSLQHLWRIGRAKNVKWWTAGVAFIPTSSTSSSESHVRVARDMWKRIHAPTSKSSEFNSDDEEDIDPWDRLNTQHTPVFNDTTHRAPVPDLSAVSSPLNPNVSPIPPCFVAQVDALPRGVDIEWSAAGLTSNDITFKRDITHSNVTVTTPANTRTRFYTLEIRKMADIEVLQRLGEESVESWTSATFYTGGGFSWGKGMSLRGVQWIPCLRVWGDDGGEVRGVFVGRVDCEGHGEERKISRSESAGKIFGKLVGGLRRGSR